MHPIVGMGEIVDPSGSLLRHRGQGGGGEEGGREEDDDDEVLLTRRSDMGQSQSQSRSQGQSGVAWGTHGVSNLQFVSNVLPSASGSKGTLDINASKGSSIPGEGGRGGGQLRLVNPSAAVVITGPAPAGGRLVRGTDRQSRRGASTSGGPVGTGAGAGAGGGAGSGAASGSSSGARSTTAPPGSESKMQLSSLSDSESEDKLPMEL